MSYETNEKYDIRHHLNALTPSKGSKTKYLCPVCDGDDLDINKATGAYSCFSGGCECKDIRAAIDEREGKPEWKPEQDDWKKPVRPKSEKDYFYPDRNGDPLIKVVRIDHGDGLKKGFPQSHWAGGRWEEGNPKKIRYLIPIYRYQQVRQAIERGELIFHVEGEATADSLWELGIAATTTLGGSDGYSKYGNYQADLAEARIVVTPDRDSKGIKYIANIERDFPTQIEGYYLAGTQGLWRNPEGAMDIGDDINDHNLTREQILDKVISVEEYRKVTNVDNQPTNLSTGNLREKLSALVNTGQERSDLKIRLTELAKEYKTPISILESIIKEMELEVDRDERRSTLKDEVDRLTAARATGANIHNILPAALAHPISMLAKSLGHNCEPYMLYLLVGTGGVLHAESFIRLRTGYEQPGNLYGGIVAESGKLKSTVQGQMLTKPLNKLQKKYNQQYREEFAKYEIANEKWTSDSGEPKPTAPHHHVVYTNSMTMEAMDMVAAKQPEQSAIYIKDELKAIFTSANQYRRGDDIQAYLSRYDGEQLSRIRSVTGFFNSDHDVKFTMMGTIQPGVLADLAGNSNDDDGLMARFLFALLECLPVRLTREGGIDVVDLIGDIYTKVHQLPPTIYKLTSSAFDKFAAEFDRMRFKSFDRSLKGWERNVWSKAGGQLGRIMLNLHLIWHVSEPNTTLGTSFDLIQPETVERAIQLIRYFIDQAIGIIANQSPELSPQLARILELAREKGSITPRIIIHCINGKNKPKNTKQALELLQELTAMKYGSLAQNGRSFVFTANVDNVDNLLTHMSTPQSTDANDSEEIVDIVDNIGHIPKKIDSVSTFALANEKDRPSKQGELAIVDLVEYVSTKEPSSSHSNSFSNGEANDCIATLPPPSRPIALLKGDRVKNKLTGEEGTIDLWSENRTEAKIEFDNGDLSNWIAAADLELIERLC